MPDRVADQLEARPAVSAAFPQLKPGLVHVEQMVVEARHTVPEIAPWPGFSDMPPVFATAMMIGFMEQTCIQALRALLPDGIGTVGTGVDIRHVAPTPIAARVTAKVELRSAQAQRLVFAVTIVDDHGEIGTGFHQRAVVDLTRFEEHVAKRSTLP